MAYVAILILMLAAFSIVGWPLVSSARRLRPQAANPSALDELLSRRDSAYRALKELDFEREVGHLSEGDYRDLRSRYRARAAAILKEIEDAGGEVTELEAASASASPDGSIPCPSCTKPTESSDEYCWSCGARLETLCPGCGRSADRADNFCGYCGHRLGATA